MNNDLDLTFAAAEAAGTLPRGFLRGSDAQRVLANYQRVMRMIFGYATEFRTGPEGNPPADRMILNRIPRGGSRPKAVARAIPRLTASECYLPLSRTLPAGRELARLGMGCTPLTASACQGNGVEP